MSKENRTLSMLLNNLDDDFAWRIKELSVIKSRIPKQESDEQRVLIRAGITILYAHWEGFVKTAAENYLNFVSLRKLKHNELQPCFLALCFKKQINDLKTNKFELQEALAEFILTQLDTKANVPYENIIETKSNLKFGVFRDICIIIGIDYRKYQLKEKIIDDSLVKSRNNIAHGKFLTIKYKDYEDLHNMITGNNMITGMLREIKDDIVDAAINEKYKRS